MDYKDKYKKYVETNFKPQDNFEKLCKEMEINNMKNNNNKKYVKYGLGFLATAVVIGGVVVGFNFIGKGNKTQQVDKLVTLTLNNDNMITDLASATPSFDDTSITLSVDKNNKVYSVYGDDQLAKMVIVNESIIGKDVNEALKTIVDIEINTGLIIKGSISGSDNALEISVSAQLSEEAEAYLKQLKETVEQKITNSNIRATVETVKGIALEEIKKEVKEINPNLDVDKMTYEDMIKTIAIHHINMSSLYSEQLENLYYDAKDYKIEFAEKEVTKNIVNSLDSNYKLLKQAYSDAVEALDKAIIDLNKAKYDAIMSPESDFQKAYVELNNKLNDLIISKNTIDIDNNKEVIEYKAKKLAFETSLKAMDIASSSVDALCSLAETALKSAKDLLTSIEAKLPDSIKEQITNDLKKQEANINSLKDKAFQEFEKEHKEDIKKVKENLKKQKEALIEGIKNA